jgi:hypothetical protein
MVDSKKKTIEGRLETDLLDRLESACCQNLLEFNQTYQQKVKETVDQVAMECRKDATTVMNLNKQVGIERDVCREELATYKRARISSGATPSYLMTFREGLNQIFAWWVTFLIWPMALHDPDSELCQLLAKNCGMQIKQGPTGIVRGWTCQFLAVVISILWWLFLAALGKQFLWDRNSSKNFNDREVTESPPKITKWKKLKQKVAMLLSRLTNVAETSQTASKVRYVRRGGAITPILEYPDFLLFATIHACKICIGSPPVKSIQLNQVKSRLKLNKVKSRLKLIEDKLIPALGSIALVLVLSFAHLPPDGQRFNNFQVTPQIIILNNTRKSLEIDSTNQFRNQVESDAITFAEAKLHQIETQMQAPKPKNKLWRKRFQRLKRGTNGKPKSNFCGRTFKQRKQVKKLSDLPPFETTETDEIVEQVLKKTVRYKVSND